MTLERLMEAAMRLAAAPYAFIRISADVTEHHTFDKAGYKLASRRTTLTVTPYGSNTDTVYIGEAEVDLNEIVLKITYDKAAPWWAVKPFADAMEGK